MMRASNNNFCVLTLALAIVLVGLSILVDPARAALVDDLEGYFNLNEPSGQVVLDTSGNIGRDGFLGSLVTVDGNDPARIGGYIGSGALDFSPVSSTDTDLVTLAASNSYIGTGTGTPRTLMTWVKVDIGAFNSLIQGSRLVTLKGTSGTVSSLAVGNSTDGGFSGTVSAAVAPMDSNGDFVIAADTAFPDDEWHHVAISYTGAGMPVTFYLDGQADGTTGTVTINPAGTTVATLGAFTSVLQPLDGQMDDVGIWSRSLTPAEISIVAALGDAGFVGAGNNLPLDSGELDALLGLSSPGDMSTAANIDWAFASVFPADFGGATLGVGLHYFGVDGLRYIIQGGTPGNFTGLQEVIFVPEPSTLLLLGLGALGLAPRRGRRRASDPGGCFIRHDRTLNPQAIQRKASFCG